MSSTVLVGVLSLLAVTYCDYTVTIYPELLQIGSASHFDQGRWNSKNDLDIDANIPPIIQVGSTAGRWLNRDKAGGIFEKAKEDPHRKGYPDPAYFHAQEHNITYKYVMNMQGYGNPEMVMELKGFNWPHWMNTSLHHGFFPNNIDAAAEMVFQLIQAVDRGSGGKLPTFFEVINEPDAQWQNTNWTTYVNFHQAVAQKVKGKYPHLKIGGPTYTGASTYFDNNNFVVWRKLEDFMDMALKHLDFFSFHSYANIDVKGGTHTFGRSSEAKLFGLLDLIDSYAHKKTGKGFNVIVSEFGMSGISGISAASGSPLLEWAHIYQHNVQLFTYMGRRDIMRKVVAFLLSYSEHWGQESINFSILDKHHNERDISQAFRFWKNFKNTMFYLRVDSQFHGAERQIIPHVLVDPTTGSLYILLHNHDKKATNVVLDFDKNWFHPASGKSTCEHLNGQKKPVLDVDKPIHVSKSTVTVPPESSCYFQFHTTHNLAHLPTVTQATYFSRDMVIPIHGAVDTSVSIPALGKIAYAHLRIGVSLSSKSAKPKPTSVMFNSNPLTSFYSLKSYNTPTDTSVWQTYEFLIPVNVLKQHGNNVKLNFAQNGGFVSTVTVVIGRH